MMQKRIVFLALFLSLASLGILKAHIFPDESLWKLLMQIEWKYKYNEEFKAKVPVPKFNDKIKALADKEVTITGFVVPMEMYGGKGNEFTIISAFPASSCFFCGGSGPESVMEVYPKKKNKASTLKTKVTYKGKLELNYNDFNHLIYILRDAELVSSN